MRTWVYKGSRKANTYLFIDRQDDFSRVPPVLLELMGEISLVIDLNLATREKLAQADINDVRQKLAEQGYFIQMPPGDHKVEKIC